MASSSAWADFETFRHNVKLNTVDRLKQILSAFNEECGTNFTKSGRKQELIDRIVHELDGWRRINNTEKWAKAKAILSHVRSAGGYTPTKMSPEHSFSASAPPHRTYPASGVSSYQASASGSSRAIPPYDPYAPPRIPTAPHQSTSSTSASPAPGIRFKPSPFFKVDRAVSNVVECPESTSAMDRRQQTLTFTLTSDVVAKLQSSSPRYQLRLYCTSSTYYSSSNAFRSTTGPCPIEFPPTCEVRVNSVALSANLKGMKKKPGTAPPPDLGKSLRVTNNNTNRIEMVYVNSQQPVQSKKYYLIVMLVETTTVDQLIDRLKKGKYRSKEDILTKMKQAASADDDIVAGSQKMSLKCPLSYMRISAPCRSIFCPHPQCFDALSWFSLMEQTTTWLCPVCEKVLNVEDLIVDGYFDEILKLTPDSVEDVIVESDGQWHTSDNKYGSAEWKALHPPIVEPPPSLPPPIIKRSDSETDDALSGKPRPPESEIVILDSDDEDEGRVKRELSPSYTGPPSTSASQRSQASQPPRTQTRVSDVIDLTLDSDDEEGVLPAPPPKKRKAVDDDLSSPTESIWKKSRNDPPVLASSSMANGAGSTAAYDSRYPPARDVPSLSYGGGSPRQVGSQRYLDYNSGPAQAYMPPQPMPRPVHNGHYHHEGNPYMPRTNGTSSAAPEGWRP